jgi:hypothetical protein
MHKTILKNIPHENLSKFVDKILDDLKASNHEMYERYEECLYVDTFGYHFNRELLDRALSHLINEDGTIGGHWTVDQTNGVARSIGVSFDAFNEYDFNYVMNMLYSDLYGSINADATAYGKMAQKWLKDKDAKSGKALRYYLAIPERT